MTDEDTQGMCDVCLRTYYTWKIVDSPDNSYQMIVMGLLEWAEMSSGIIISCFPVLLKYSSHMGPKIFKSPGT